MDKVRKLTERTKKLLDNLHTRMYAKCEQTKMFVRLGESAPESPNIFRELTNPGGNIKDSYNH